MPVLQGLLPRLPHGNRHGRLQVARHPRASQGTVAAPEPLLLGLAAALGTSHHETPRHRAAHQHRRGRPRVGEPDEMGRRGRRAAADPAFRVAFRPPPHHTAGGWGQGTRPDLGGFVQRLLRVELLRRGGAGPGPSRLRTPGAGQEGLLRPDLDLNGPARRRPPPAQARRRRAGAVRRTGHSDRRGGAELHQRVALRRARTAARGHQREGVEREGPDPGGVPGQGSRLPAPGPVRAHHRRPAPLPPRLRDRMAD